MTNKERKIMTQSINYNSNGPHMESLHTGYAIKPVKSTMQLISVVNGIVGGTLLGVGAILFLISLQLGNPGAVLGLRLAGVGVAFGGIVELVVSTVFRRIARREEEKLGLLKSTGTSYPAEITRITHKYAIMVGRKQSVYAECTYTNNEGKTCLVKSNSFMYDNTANHDAVVYVDPYNPHEYAVEILTTAGTTRADYDYR